jgi:hypothetical protein
MWPDFLNDEAFSLNTLTAVINERDFVPGRAGALAFAGVGAGVATTTVSLESIGGSISLVQTSPRGGPAPQDTREKGTLRVVNIPQVKLEETIGVHSIQNVRALGSTSALRGMRQVIDQQIELKNQRFDLTLEHHRLGALKGRILDADGTTLTDLFTLFGVQEPTPIDFSDVFALEGSTDAGDGFETVRTKVHQVTRFMKRNLKAALPPTARIWALTGDQFFDRLVEATSVKGVFDGYAAAERRLGGNYAFGIYEFADVFWENYQGTDDDSETVGIAPNEARFFLTGVPGLYAEYYAPADFEETVNTIGLPRYARIARDPEFGRWVKLHAQMNPLPICTRPRTLVKATWSEAPTF